MLDFVDQRSAQRAIGSLDIDTHAIGLALDQHAYVVVLERAAIQCDGLRALDDLDVQQLGELCDGLRGVSHTNRGGGMEELCTAGEYRGELLLGDGQRLDEDRSRHDQRERQRARASIGLEGELSRERSRTNGRRYFENDLGVGGGLGSEGARDLGARHVAQRHDQVRQGVGSRVGNVQQHEYFVRVGRVDAKSKCLKVATSE